MTSLFDKYTEIQVDILKNTAAIIFLKIIDSFEWATVMQYNLNFNGFFEIAYKQLNGFLWNFSNKF